jgi:hypothetical protein
MKPMRVILLVCTVALLAPASALASAPGATTGAATDVGSDSATLNGVVNPNKEDTAYHFEYGTTTSYGSVTPDGVVGGNAGKDVSATVTGLAPNTTYHYRLVATNPSGSDQGADMTFTTAASPYTFTPALSIAANPVTITFGRTSAITGQLTNASTVSGVSVQLQAAPHPFTAPFANLGAPATTDPSGGYGFNVRPGRHTRYQAIAQSSPPATSGVVEVRVRYAVSLRTSARRVRRGRRVRLSGAVSPAADGKRVAIRRRTRTGAFKTVARVVLRAAKGNRSLYRKRVRVRRKATYRTVKPGDAGHLVGKSRRRTIRIN